MSKGYKIVGVVVGVAIVAAVAVGALLITQPAAAAVLTRTSTARFGPGGGAAMCGQAGLDAAAKALNMSTSDLQTQLRGGSTLSDLATKANVKLADVEAAIDAACKTQLESNIDAAVKAGKLTQDKADWLKQGLDKGYWGPGATNGGGFGFGGFGGGFFGFGGGPGFGPGRGWPGRGNGPNNKPKPTPQATPSNTSQS